MVNLLSNLGGFLVHAGLQKTLSMVKLVLEHIWVELGQLVVHIRGCCVILDVEVAVGKKGEGSAVSWLELELVCENSNDL